jgi:integrase
LYQEVLKQDIRWLDDVVRAKTAKKLPIVLTREEVKAVLTILSGSKWVMANLLYGSGLRLMECIRLRVKDVGFSYNHSVVRDGKGDKDRVTMLPHNVKSPLLRHLQEVKKLHARDLTEGFGSVYLPHGLERKYPHANREWGWQYVFPSAKRSIDPRTGAERRHHISPLVLQRAVREARRQSGQDGRRPVYGGTGTFQEDPHWRDCLLFYEYFHGDNGAGLGASHQTGWTGGDRPSPPCLRDPDAGAVPRWPEDGLLRFNRAWAE